MWSWIRSVVGGGRQSRYGLFLDGPNLLRDDVGVDLNEVRDRVDARGDLVLGRVYLDHRASASLVQAVEAAGFEVVTTSGDVDVRLAVDATEAIVGDAVDGVVIATRDLDFKPVLELARRMGVTTVVVVPEGVPRSEGLLAASDEVITLTA